MRSPFVDSASFLSAGFGGSGRRAAAGLRLLAFALVTVVAASSSVLIAI